MGSCPAAPRGRSVGRRNLRVDRVSHPRLSESEAKGHGKYLITKWGWQLDYHPRWEVFDEGIDMVSAAHTFTTKNKGLYITTQQIL